MAFAIVAVALLALAQTNAQLGPWGDRINAFQNWQQGLPTQDIQTQLKEQLGGFPSRIQEFGNRLQEQATPEHIQKGWTAMKPELDNFMQQMGDRVKEVNIQAPQIQQISEQLKPQVDKMVGRITPIIPNWQQYYPQWSQYTTLLSQLN